MNNQQNTESDSRKWDETAIDQAYENLIDIIGWILDQITVTGCRPLFRSNPALAVFLEMLESIENEMLIQWKIKEENGLEVLFARHNEWFNQELRQDDGFFAQWNSFRIATWKSIENTRGIQESDPWKRLLLLTLTDYNLVKRNLGPLSPEVLVPVCRLFEQLFSLSPHHLGLSFLNLVELGTRTRPDLYALESKSSEKNGLDLLEVLDKAFSEPIKTGQWQTMPEKLLEFWESNSGGIYSCFPAFVIEGFSENRLSLRGVVPEKWLDFDQLIGIESNRNKLIDNTLNFVEGRFAHHVLLWGGRGTGKSSSVLALVKKFVDRGLRIIEIRQEDLELIPTLSESLRERPEKFILFCDDLSFDQNNADYKHLKTILEGSVLNPAKNILLIATANRKDLVFRGELDERYPEQKQLIDEKRAIDDRFGLKLYYEVPVFKDLKKILYACADKTGISYAPDELMEQFNRFAQFNNHDQPSGRTVNQFISEWQQREST